MESGVPWNTATIPIAQKYACCMVDTYMFAGKKKGAKNWRRNQKTGSMKLNYTHGYKDLAIETVASSPV